MPQQPMPPFHGGPPPHGGPPGRPPLPPGVRVVQVRPPVPVAPPLPPRRTKLFSAWRTVSLVVLYSALGLELLIGGCAVLFGGLFTLVLTLSSLGSGAWLLTVVPVVLTLVVLGFLIYLPICERRIPWWTHGPHAGFQFLLAIGLFVRAPWIGGSFMGLFGSGSGRFFTGWVIVTGCLALLAIAGSAGALFLRRADIAANPEHWAEVNHRAGVSKASKERAASGPSAEPIPPWEAGPPRGPGAAEPDPTVYDSFLDQNFPHTRK